MRAVAALAGAAVIVAGCQYVRGEQEVRWALAQRVTPSSTALDLVVFVGSSSCHDFRRVDVEEDESEVRVTAYVTSSGDEDCTADDVRRLETVELDAPLGDRALRGCRVEVGTCTDVAGQ